MKIDVINMDGKKISSVELPSAIFEAPIQMSLMHQAFVRQMANARLGTHETKTRHEVSGGGRKPWRQKGTGRARQGSIRSAQWVGGGKIHTPHQRSYNQDMPRKMRRAALRSALSVKAMETGIVVVDELSLPEPKTRLMERALDNMIGDASALILLPEKDAYEQIIRSTNNLPYAKTMLSNYLNVRDLLRYDKVIMPLSVLDKISEHLG